MKRRSFLSMMLGAGGAGLLPAKGLSSVFSGQGQEPAADREDLGLELSRPVRYDLRPSGLEEVFLQFDTPDMAAAYQKGLERRSRRQGILVIGDDPEDAVDAIPEDRRYWAVTWEHDGVMDILMHGNGYACAGREPGFLQWLEAFSPGTPEEVAMVQPLYINHILTGRSPDFASLAFNPTHPGIETILGQTRGMLIWHRQLHEIIRLVAPDIREPMLYDVAYCCMLGWSECIRSVNVLGRPLADVLFERAAFRDLESGGFRLDSDDTFPSTLWEALTHSRR